MVVVVKLGGDVVVVVVELLVKGTCVDVSDSSNSHTCISSSSILCTLALSQFGDDIITNVRTQSSNALIVSNDAALHIDRAKMNCLSLIIQFSVSSMYVLCLSSSFSFFSVRSNSSVFVSPWRLLSISIV